MSNNKISKADLLKKIAEKSGVSVKDTASVFNAIGEVSLEELKEGNKVQINSLVTLKPELKKATTRKNALVKDANGNPTVYETPEKTVIKAVVSNKYKVLKIH